MSVQSKLSRGTSGVPGYNLPSRGRLSTWYGTIGTVISKRAAWVSKGLRLVFIPLWFCCCCCCNSGYQTQGHALPWLCASLHIFFWRRGRKKKEKGGEEEERRTKRGAAAVGQKRRMSHRPGYLGVITFPAGWSTFPIKNYIAKYDFIITPLSNKWLLFIQHQLGQSLCQVLEWQSYVRNTWLTTIHRRAVTQQLTAAALSRGSRTGPCREACS